MSELTNNDDNKSLELVNWIADRAIEGIGPLCGAKELAAQYNADKRLRTPRQRSLSLIKWEMSKNFASGFVTGMGGLPTLLVAVPAALGASWIIQARLAGTIALFYGWELEDDRVRTLVLLSLVGDAGKELLKRAGIQAGEKLTRNAIMQIPGKVFIEINKRIGFRLLTKAGEKGVLNMTKVIPLVGGAIGGVVDASACKVVGRVAMSLFCETDEIDEVFLELAELARECDEQLGFNPSDCE